MLVKPRLWFGYGMWWCSESRTHPTNWELGSSPKQAYTRWLQQKTERALKTRRTPILWQLLAQRHQQLQH